MVDLPVQNPVCCPAEAVFKAVLPVAASGERHPFSVLMPFGISANIATPGCNTGGDTGVDSFTFLLAGVRCSRPERLFDLIFRGWSGEVCSVFGATATATRGVAAMTLIAGYWCRGSSPSRAATDTESTSRVEGSKKIKFQDDKW
jgi:hypothetical protein